MKPTSFLSAAIAILAMTLQPLSAQENAASLVPLVSPDQLSNDSVYCIVPRQIARGFMCVRPGQEYLSACGGWTNGALNKTIKESYTDPNQQFAIYEWNGYRYLYSIGAKKFAQFFTGTSPHVYCHVGDQPANYLTFYPTTAPEDTYFSICMGETNKLNISFYNYGVIGHYNTEDEGNRLAIVPVAPLAAQDKAEIEAALEAAFGNEKTNIQFEDEAVRSLVVSNWDIDGDGEMNLQEAAGVTSFGEVFSYNYDIATFRELRYFTGLGDLNNYAFAYCNNLTDVILPPTLMRIDESFTGSGLKSITIPRSLTEFDAWSFANCIDLADISVEEGNAIYSSPDNCNAVMRTADNIFILGGVNSVIPANTEAIGPYAFYGRYNLHEVTIPEGVKTLYRSAFCACNRLQKLHIPASVTMIYEWAVNDCNSLTELTVADDNTVYDSRDNCNAVIHTKTNELIAGCQTTVIPSTVRKIGTGAFYGQGRLNYVKLPDALTTIGTEAFSFCESLTEITIPKTILSIGEHAFSYCYSMERITLLRANTNFTVYDNTFWRWYGLEGDEDNPSLYEQATLYVPEGKTAMFAKHAVWGKFKQIKESAPTAIGNINAIDTSASNTEAVYTTDGRLLTSPATGINIIRTPNGEARKVLFP